MDRLAIAYHVDDSFYPNVGRTGGSGASAETQRVYWSNILVLAASVRRWGGEPVAFEVYTNAEPPAGLRPHLEALGVTSRSHPFRREPPRDYADRYRASFYLFDVLDDLVDRMAEGDRAAIIDPDCVFIDDVDRLWQRIDRDGLVVHHIDQPADLSRHGHSRQTLAEIAEDEHPGEVGAPPTWIGGELLGFDLEHGRRFRQLVQEAWSMSLQRYEAGRPYFRSDEHLSTYVFWRMGWTRGNAADLLARLYTNTHPLPRNVSDDPLRNECRLALWHLPGEKEVGLRQLVEDATPPHGALLTLDDDGYRHHVGEVLGVLPTWRRRLSDELRRLRRVPYRLRERLTSR